MHRRVQSFSYMENRRIKENILSEYQKYTLKIWRIMQQQKKISAFFFFLLSVMNKSLLKWILRGNIFIQIHVLWIIFLSLRTCSMERPHRHFENVHRSIPYMFMLTVCYLTNDTKGHANNLHCYVYFTTDVITGITVKLKSSEVTLSNK